MVSSVHDQDELFTKLKFIRDVECEDPHSVPDDELRQIAGWAWGCRLENKIYQERDSAFSTPRQALDVLRGLPNASDAIALYVFLLDHHGHLPAKAFALNWAAMKYSGHTDLSRRRFLNARRALEQVDLLQVAAPHQAGKCGRTYRLARLLPKSNNVTSLQKAKTRRGSERKGFINYICRPVLVQRGSGLLKGRENGAVATVGLRTLAWTTIEEYNCDVMRLVVITYFLTHLFTVCAAAQEAPRKVALVIGNSAYQHVPSLRNPANDATDIAAALVRLGFDVTLLLDQNDVQMRRALLDFSKLSKDASLSLVYFAGHGIEINKKNYLIPINAELRADQDAEFEAIQLGSVLRSLSGGEGITLMLVDACRDNPFASRLIDGGASRSIGTGLVRVDPVGGVLPGGTLISYAAREGTFALDGNGRNSPYAQGLLEHLEEPGLEVSKLFRKVRDRVFVLTDGRQEPFTYGSLPGADIFFKPPIVQTAIPEADRNLVREFAIAEREDTLGAWANFLGKFGERSDHELVEIAGRRRNVLRGLPYATRMANDRELWLKPKAGSFSTGPIELTLEERKLVQKALGYLGMEVGTIDGQFGPKTERAISAARLKFGLVSGNYVDLDLLRALPNVHAIDALLASSARSFEGVSVSDLQEPRLEKALRGLGNRKAVFGYFEGRLYFAVLGSAHDFGLARGNALARGMGGHLATIKDRAEDEFVFQLFRTADGFSKPEFAGQNWGVMIGLYRPTDRSGRLGRWVWITGEQVNYTNWASGSPHSKSTTNFVAAYYARRGSTKQRRPSWRDTRGSTNRFAIEIE